MNRQLPEAELSPTSIAKEYDSVNLQFCGYYACSLETFAV